MRWFVLWVGASIGGVWWWLHTNRDVPAETVIITTDQKTITGAVLVAVIGVAVAVLRGVARRRAGG